MPWERGLLWISENPRSRFCPCVPWAFGLSQALLLMSIPSRNELKRELVAQGFEVYRTLPDRIVLADRVRDNLIMDSGVAAVIGELLAVRFVVRAQSSDFPGETPDELFGRTRTLAMPGRAVGYREIEQSVVPVRDPGDKERILDTWCELTLERKVSSVAELMDELRRALSLDKTASPAKRG